MFRGFASGRGQGLPRNSRNVRQQTVRYRDRGDGAEANANMTADPPTERSGSRDVPDAEDSRVRAQGWHGQGRNPEAQESERLRSNAEAAIINRQDVQLQNIIRRSHEEMGQMPDRAVPTSAEATTLIVRMLDLANQRLEPRQAAIYLAYAHWDYEAAVERYIEERFEDDENPLSDADDSFSDLEFDDEEEEDEGQEGEAEDEDDVEENDIEDYFAQMRRLNKHISRKGPIKGTRNDSLLVIRLRNPGGRPDTVKRYLDVHPGPVDWDRDLRAISRWRSQVFRRALGSIRNGRTKYHEVEKQWLVEAHVEFERRSRRSGSGADWRKMDWRQLAVDFNRRFQGRILPGDPQPRPVRTALSLRNERARIKAITDITGLKPKDQGPKK